MCIKFTLAYTASGFPGRTPLGSSVNRGNPPSSVRHTCLILKALGIADRALEERQANFSYWGWLSRLPLYCRSFRGMRDGSAKKEKTGWTRESELLERPTRNTTW